MTPLQKQIREEFGREFIYDEFDNTGLKILGNREANCPVSDEEIINWWLSKLKSQNEELVKKIEELLKTPQYNKTQSYDRAIKDVLTIIQSQNYE